MAATALGIYQAAAGGTGVVGQRLKRLLKGWVHADVQVTGIPSAAHRARTAAYEESGASF